MSYECIVSHLGEGYENRSGSENKDKVNFEFSLKEKLKQLSRAENWIIRDEPLPQI